jgi:uroporphyrinogen-III synthase
MSLRLDGHRVLVTREADRAAPVAARVVARGGIPVLFPTITTLAPRDPAPLQAAAAHLHDYDWVAVSSRIGVEALATAVRSAGGSMAAGERPRYAAVGAGTAEALRSVGVPVALVPDRQDADGLLAAMRAAGAGDAHVLIVRGEAGRDVLADGLRADGARVDFVVGYRTGTAHRSPADIHVLRAGGPLDAALFMSPSSFHGWVENLGADALPWLDGVFVVAIGHVTADALVAGGRSPDAVAPVPSVDAMLDCAARGLRTRD